MTIKGITPTDEFIIKDILSKFFDKYTFYYYGSRVKGDFTPLSDLDILVKGSQPFNLNDKEELKNAFDISNLPYIVNFTDYYSTSQEFYKLIEKDLVQI